MSGGSGLRNIATAFAAMPNKDVINGSITDNTLGKIINTAA